MCSRSPDTNWKTQYNNYFRKSKINTKSINHVININKQTYLGVSHGLGDEIAPELLVPLLLHELNGLLDVADLLDDEVQRVLGVSHSTQDVDHLRIALHIHELVRRAT